MSYAGHIPDGLDPRKREGVVKLLHIALMKVPADKLHRGPRQVHDGTFTYTNRVQVKLNRLFGDDEDGSRGRNALRALLRQRVWALRRHTPFFGR
jgi:hypothetical protein